MSTMHVYTFRLNTEQLDRQISLRDASDHGSDAQKVMGRLGGNPVAEVR